MNGSLEGTLKELIRSAGDSNPALNALIADYTKYHVVLVVVGGMFLLGLFALGVVFWKRFKRAPKTGSRRWSFEKKTYFCFSAVSVLVGLLMALIVAANVSNVLDPRQGFEGSISMLGTPQAGTQADDLYDSVNTWVQSGSTDVPSLLQGKIDDRLSWQRPKAIICSVLLVLLALLSARIWRTLIRKSRGREAKWKLPETGLLVLGVVTVGACLLLMLMVMGNTQASIAPISLTLFYG